ncbi:MAG: hypothetical protein FJ189_05590, partial [Gammaproteobacteria bacterium]|nr:hypothetical protein [Gammaproteobacteria bacterium]
MEALEMRYPIIQALLILALPGPGTAAATPPQKSTAGSPVRVESFSPQGTVKTIRQVTARFSAPMVRFGDARGPQPFDIDCPATGQGHWLDNRTWVYDFAADLPAGQRCAFTLHKSLRALEDRAVSGPASFAFDTGGPSIIDSLPGEGQSGIDADQAFVLALDAPIGGDSLAAHVHCEVDGLGEQIEVRPLTGAARHDVLNPELRRNYRYFFERFPDDKTLDDLVVVLQCRRSLPPDSTVRLVWGPGVAARDSGLFTAQAQALEFRTRAAFTARFECERVNAQAQCVPFLPMKLAFSAPVPAEHARGIRLIGTADGRAYEPEPPEAAGKATVEQVVFKAPFPESTKFEIRLPAELTDDAGRTLENAQRFPFEVATDEYPPLAKFSGEFGIIEVGEGGVLPVTLRNLEDTVAAQVLGSGAAPGAPLSGQLQRIDGDDSRIIQWLKTVKTAAERRGEWLTGTDKQPHWRELTGSTSVFAGTPGAIPLSIPKPLGGKAFEVVGIPLPTPGFYVVELASPRLGAALLGTPAPRYVATSALVTNLAVHFKWGREASRVWVTTLDSAQPVPNADVRISGYCKGNLLWSGRTGPDGLAAIGDGELPAPNDDGDCGEWNEARPPLFVSARTGDQLGFTFSGWNRGIRPSDFGLATGSTDQTRVIHAVLDRNLLRAGETVSMKLFLRDRVMSGFAIPSGARPDGLRLTHTGSGQEYPLPILFDERGIAEMGWTIPRDAKLGGYDIRLYRGDQWVSDAGQFQVQQFRVPTMRAVIQPGAGPLVNASSASVDLFVTYLSGGGAAGLPVTLRTQLRPRSLTYPGYEDFVFGGKDVSEGLQDQVDDEAVDTPQPARAIPLTLDRAGSNRA